VKLANWRAFSGRIGNGPDPSEESGLGELRGKAASKGGGLIQFSLCQDVGNPASNLLASASGGRWLCASENKSRTAEVVVELCKRVRICSLELCESTF